MKIKKEKNNWKNYVLPVCMIGTIIFIWSNSMMPASISSHESQGLLEYVYPFMKMVGIQESMAHHVLRKAAHMTEFAALGFFSTAIIKSKVEKVLLCICISLQICGFVAFIDETIQLFSEGRGSSVSDMWIDVMGGFIGTFLFLVGFVIIYRRKKYYNK